MLLDCLRGSDGGCGWLLLRKGGHGWCVRFVGGALRVVRGGTEFYLPEGSRLEKVQYVGMNFSMKESQMSHEIWEGQLTLDWTSSEHCY